MRLTSYQHRQMLEGNPSLARIFDKMHGPLGRQVDELSDRGLGDDSVGSVDNRQHRTAPIRVQRTTTKIIENRGDTLNRLLADAKRFPMLSPEREQELARTWRGHGDQAALREQGGIPDMTAAVPLGHQATRRQQMHAAVSAGIAVDCAERLKRRSSVLTGIETDNGQTLTDPP